MKKIILAAAALCLLVGPAEAAYIGSSPLLVGNGGTGASSLTQYGPLVGGGSGAVQALSPVAGSVLYQSSATANPSMSAAPVLGVAGTSTGTLGLAGSTSGTITIQPQVAAGTYNLNLPTGAGSSGQILASGGGGATAMTFDNLSSHLTAGTGITMSGTTNVTINATAAGWTETTYTSTTTPVTLAGTNQLFEVVSQTTPAAITVKLPTGMGVGSIQCVKDGSNNFLTNNGTVQSAGSANIDGATTYVMNQTHQEACFVYDGTNWWIGA